MFISPIGAVGNSASKISSVRRNQPEQTAQTNPTQPIANDSVSFKGGNYAEVFETQFNRKLRNINSVRDVFNELILALNKKKLFFGDTELSQSTIKNYYNNLSKGAVISLDGNLAKLSLGIREGEDVANAAKKINKKAPNFFLPIITNGEYKTFFGVRNYGRYPDKTIFDRKMDDTRFLFIDEKDVEIPENGIITNRIIEFGNDSSNDFTIARGYYPDFELYETYYGQDRGGKLKERIYADKDGQPVIEQFNQDGSIDDGSNLTPTEALTRLMERGFKSSLNSITDMFGL